MVVKLLKGCQWYMEWNKVSEKGLPFGKEVIAFNKEWINSDFNPNGTNFIKRKG